MIDRFHGQIIPCNDSWINLSMSSFSGIIIRKKFITTKKPLTKADRLKSKFEPSFPYKHNFIILIET